MVPRLSSRVPAGTLAPTFTLPSATGGNVALADYRDQAHLVLVFLRGSR